MKQKAKPVSPAALRLRNGFTIVFFTVTAILLAVWFLVFCRVKTVIIQNDGITPQPTILDAASVKSGRHLYAVSEAKIAREIIEACPYVKSVTLKRKLPSTLQICIEEYDLAYYIEYGERYYLVTDDFLVIEETTPADAAEKGAIPLSIPKLKDPTATKDEPDPPKVLEAGTTLTFDVKADKAWSLTLLESIRQTDFYGTVTAIDLSDPMDLTLSVSGKYEVRLGTEKSLEKKLSRVENALRYLSESANVLVGIIHARQDAPITFTFTGVSKETA